VGHLTAVRDHDVWKVGAPSCCGLLSQQMVPLGRLPWSVAKPTPPARCDTERSRPPEFFRDETSGSRESRHEAS